MVYVAMAVCPAQLFVLVTVMVKITILPASPDAAVYVGVKVFAFVILPAPLDVQMILP